MNDLPRWLLFTFTVVFLPPLMLGIIRKSKARLQNRIGAPVTQPLRDLIKWFSKGETISQVTSWIFRSTAAVNFVVMLIIAVMAPWATFKPEVPGADLFLLVYMFALMRFFTVLSALDAGSVFGGFGASREVTLALLVEPAIVLCLASIGSVAGSSDLSAVFSFTPNGHAVAVQPSLWLAAACGLMLAALVEFCRMPVDDPTTHLELTMIHEAMILENSGKNLALVEYTHWLKMTVLLGICGQCLMRTMPFFWQAQSWLRDAASFVFLIFSCVLIALIESAAVKLRWTKVPEFIAYSVAMSLLCVLLAVGEK